MFAFLNDFSSLLSEVISWVYFTMSKILKQVTTSQIFDPKGWETKKRDTPDIVTMNYKADHPHCLNSKLSILMRKKIKNMELIIFRTIPLAFSSSFEDLFF